MDWEEEKAKTDKIMNKEDADSYTGQNQSFHDEIQEKRILKDSDMVHTKAEETSASFAVNTEIKLRYREDGCPIKPKHVRHPYAYLIRSLLVGIIMILSVISGNMVYLANQSSSDVEAAYTSTLALTIHNQTLNSGYFWLEREQVDLTSTPNWYSYNSYTLSYVSGNNYSLITFGEERYGYEGDSSLNEYGAPGTFSPADEGVFFGINSAYTYNINGNFSYISDQDSLETIIVYYAFPSSSYDKFVVEVNGNSTPVATYGNFNIYAYRLSESDIVNKRVTIDVYQTYHVDFNAYLNDQYSAGSGNDDATAPNNFRVEIDRYGDGTYEYNSGIVADWASSQTGCIMVPYQARVRVTVYVAKGWIYKGIGHYASQWDHNIMSTSISYIFTMGNISALNYYVDLFFDITTYDLKVRGIEDNVQRDSLLYNKFTVKIDENGDGNFDQVFNNLSSFSSANQNYMIPYGSFITIISIPATGWNFKELAHGQTFEDPPTSNDTTYTFQLTNITEQDFYMYYVNLSFTRKTYRLQLSATINGGYSDIPASTSLGINVDQDLDGTYEYSTTLTSVQTYSYIFKYGSKISISSYVNSYWENTGYGFDTVKTTDKDVTDSWCTFSLSDNNYYVTVHYESYQITFNTVAWLRSLTSSTYTKQSTLLTNDLSISIDENIDGIYEKTYSSVASLANYRIVTYSGVPMKITVKRGDGYEINAILYSTSSTSYTSGTSIASDGMFNTPSVSSAKTYYLHALFYYKTYNLNIATLTNGSASNASSNRFRIEIDVANDGTYESSYYSQTSWLSSSTTLKIRYNTKIRITPTVATGWTYAGVGVGTTVASSETVSSTANPYTYSIPNGNNGTTYYFKVVFTLNSYQLDLKGVIDNVTSNSIGVGNGVDISINGYMVEEDTSMFSQTVPYGSTITISIANLSTNYWYQGMKRSTTWIDGPLSQANGQADQVQSRTISLTMPASNTVLSMYLFDNLYTVFVTKGDHVVSASDGGQYPYGTTITVNAAAEKGYWLYLNDSELEGIIVGDYNQNTKQWEFSESFIVTSDLYFDFTAGSSAITLSWSTELEGYSTTDMPTTLPNGLEYHIYVYDSTGVANPDYAVSSISGSITHYASFGNGYIRLSGYSSYWYSLYESTGQTYESSYTYSGSNVTITTSTSSDPEEKGVSFSSSKYTSGTIGFRVTLKQKTWTRYAASLATTSLTETATDTYTISSVDDWARFAYMAANGNNFSGKTINLATDLNLDGKYSQPVGKNLTNGNGISGFYGMFNGQGHTISNVKILCAQSYGGYDIGLFAAVGNTVQNLYLKNIDYLSSTYYVGGITAYLMSGSATITDCAVLSGTLKGGVVGGIVGNNNGKLLRSFVSEDVIIEGVGTSSYVGGIAGVATAYIKYCYSFASVTGNTSGGIVGRISSTLEACYAITNAKYAISGMKSSSNPKYSYGLIPNSNTTGYTQLTDASQLREWSIVDDLIRYGKFGYVSVNADGISTTTDNAWNSSTGQYNNYGYPILTGFMGRETHTVKVNFYLNNASNRNNTVNGYTINTISADRSYTVNTGNVANFPLNVTQATNWVSYNGLIKSWTINDVEQDTAISSISEAIHVTEDTVIKIHLVSYGVKVVQATYYTSVTMKGTGTTYSTSASIGFGYMGSYDVALRVTNTKNVIGNITQGETIIYDYNTKSTIGGVSNATVSLTGNTTADVDSILSISNVTGASTFTIKPYYAVTIDNTNVGNTVSGTKSFVVTYNGDQTATIGNETKTIYADLDQDIQFTKDACDTTKEWLFLRAIKVVDYTHATGNERYLYGSSTKNPTGSTSDYAAISVTDTSLSRYQYTSDSGVLYTMVYVNALYTLTIQYDTDQYDCDTNNDGIADGKNYTVTIKQTVDGVSTTEEKTTETGEPLLFSVRSRASIQYTIRINSTEAYAIYCDGKSSYAASTTSLQSYSITVGQADVTKTFTVLRLVTLNLTTEIGGGYGTTSGADPSASVSSVSTKTSNNVTTGYNTTTFTIDGKKYYSVGQVLTIAAQKENYTIESWLLNYTGVNGANNTYELVLSCPNTNKGTTANVHVTFRIPTMTLLVGKNRTDVNMPRLLVSQLADLALERNTTYLDPYKHTFSTNELTLSLDGNTWTIKYINYLQEQQGTSAKATRQMIDYIKYNGYYILKLNKDNSGNAITSTGSAYSYYSYTVTVGERYAIFRSDNPDGQETINGKVNRYGVESYIITIGSNTSYAEDFEEITGTNLGSNTWGFVRKASPSADWTGHAIGGATVYAAITYLPYYNYTNSIVLDMTNSSQLFASKTSEYGNVSNLIYSVGTYNQTTSSTLLDLIKNDHISFEVVTGDKVTLVGNYIKIQYTVPEGVNLVSWQGFGNVNNTQVVPYSFTLPTNDGMYGYSLTLADGSTKFDYVMQKNDNTYTMYYLMIDLSQIKEAYTGISGFADAQNYQFTLKIQEKPYNLVVNYRINGNIKIADFGTIKIYEYYLDEGKEVYDITNADYTIDNTIVNGEITIPTYVFGKFYIVLETNDPRYTYGSVSVGSNLVSSSVTTGTDSWKGTIATNNKNTTSSQTISFAIKESWTLSTNDITFTTQNVTNGRTTFATPKLTISSTSAIQNTSTSIQVSPNTSTAGSWNVSGEYYQNSCNTVVNNVWIQNGASITLSIPVIDGYTTTLRVKQNGIWNEYVSVTSKTIVVTSDLEIEIISIEKAYTLSKTLEFYNNGIAVATTNQNSNFVITVTSNTVTDNTTKIGHFGAITNAYITMPKAQSYDATSNPTGSAYYYIVDAMYMNTTSVNIGNKVSDGNNYRVSMSTLPSSYKTNMNFKVRLNAIWQVPEVGNLSNIITNTTTNESDIAADNRVGGEVNISVNTSAVNTHNMYPSGATITYESTANIGYNFTNLKIGNNTINNTTYSVTLSGPLGSAQSALTKQSYTLT